MRSSPSSDSRVRLLAPLGHGGMSDVWLGALRGPAGFAKLVAVKQLRFVGNEHYDGGAAFLREARLAALLNHPNIVHTFEVLAQGGDYRIVMEFLEGQPLNRILRRAGGQVPLRDMIRVIADLLSGLHYAHDLVDLDGRPLEVVHLDVSPHNVFVTWEGAVKLLDFGIAMFAHPNEDDDGLVKGKLSYMAPEQARGEKVDRRTDVFSAGAVLFEILSGDSLWGALGEATVLERLAAGDIPSIDEAAPTAPEALRRICRTATAPLPKDRYPSADAMRAALDRWLDETGGRPAPRGLGEKLSALFAADRERIKLLVAQGRAADDDPSHDTDLYAPVTPPRRANPDDPPAVERPSVVFRLLVPLGGALGALVFGGIGAAVLVVATVVAALWARDPRAPGGPDPGGGPGRVVADGCPAGERPQVELSGGIDVDATLTCDRDYRLVGAVRVQPGATLTIEAGTTVRGAPGSALLVEPGARIVADGRNDAPVVLTSAAPEPKPGDWGGVVLLGRAPTSMADPRFKGFRPDGDRFGGDRVDDDSGVLRFVRIEYAGTVLAPNNESNGLTLAGVGRGTVIDHVQVRRGADDCFEWFGGTVDASHLVCVDPGDDGFDLEFGYVGTLSSVVVVDRGPPDPDHDGFEIDNDATRHDAQPRSAPVVQGATVCGAGSAGGHGLLVRRGAVGTYTDLWVSGVAAALDLRDQGGLVVRDVTTGPGVPLGPTEDLGPADRTARGDDDGGIDEGALIQGSREGEACGWPPVGPAGGLEPGDRWDEGWVVWE